MFGEATPNLSIRVRSTLNEFWIALSASRFKKLRTSDSELLPLIKLALSVVAKNFAIGVPAPVAAYSVKNRSINDVLELLLFATAVSSALLKFSSLGLSARFAINSSKEISMVTFI